MEQLTDVWTLETPTEEIASDSLNSIAEQAYNSDRKSQNYLKKLWNKSWQSIKAKLEVEGSAWYVWWMDGVRQHLLNRAEEQS